MRIIETKAYQFEELSDDAKLKAIEQYRYMNVEYFDWWHSIYDDAENVGLKITEFDADRKWKISIEFIDSFIDVLNKILSNHGESCETHKIASTFKKQYDELHSKYSEDEEYELECELDELTDEFIHSIGQEYLVMLSNEFEFLISDEVVKECIINNECEFDEDGNEL